MPLLPAEDVLGTVGKLQAEEGGDLQVMGSANLAGALIRGGLVEEYRLMIEPIVLGGGKRLFPDDGQSRAFELVSTSTCKTGVHICTYRPVAS